MRRAIALPFLFFPVLMSSSMLHVKLPDRDEVDCLASAIYYESRGEPEIGQRAVAHVILNRTVYRKKSVCEVIAEPRQFSFYRKGMQLESSEEIRSIALEMLVQERNGWRADFLRGITHYTRVEVKKVWMRAFAIEVILGNHQFLREKNKTEGK